MKLEELTETVYVDDLTPQQKLEYDSKVHEFRTMSRSELRKKYKPFGKLGSLTKPEQVLRHQVTKTNKHDWGFDAQVTRDVARQKCRICGMTRDVDQKGRTKYK